MPLVLGLDIGGANLKAATSEGEACSVSFPLWKQPEKLTAALREILSRWPLADRVAVTMTGELADCYETKADGVAHILRSVMESTEERTVSVWGVDGQFHAVPTAIAQPKLVAASNWHGLATWLAREHPQMSGVLIDIGSTTTDIIPFASGRVRAEGRTDLARLQAAELLYMGVRRTPLSALCQELSLAGTITPVAAELFATTYDVYLCLGLLPEDPADSDTADGRPATMIAAKNRLSHMLCCDSTELSGDEIEAVATEFLQAQVQRIGASLRRILQRQQPECQRLFLSGTGEFLAEYVCDRMPETMHFPRVLLSQQLGSEVASAACAYALARLLESE